MRNRRAARISARLRPTDDAVDGVADGGGSERIGAESRHGAVSVAVSNGRAPVPRSIATSRASLHTRRAESHHVSPMAALRYSCRSNNCFAPMQERCQRENRERMFNVRVEIALKTLRA
ncbi:hypothetical protein [Lysobacter enzymogenes]|uniref:hypothetical protein n=1 Tax=Lysobacter enzymogenes TaxID=69 RepID=UPI001A966FAC|nr:hypothetical protein [Lysobacter enzymogenes]QQP96994.1 hypothetical protein JHW38_02745 [Lysobacter enzymogenes]